ncbi:hypothetical protein M0802_014543 [Mischocyttarus mexicanus]|nr:hypothetical protein M0802_014543 [Mischocyttarus mexicanus]
MLRGGVAVTVKKPNVIINYIKHMGGVDRADQLAATYCFLRKSLKWWRKLFFWGLEICSIKSYLMYKMTKQQRGEQPLSHLRGKNIHRNAAKRFELLVTPSENGLECKGLKEIFLTPGTIVNNFYGRTLQDTGSEESIINSKIYDKLGRPKLYETTRLLTGFGNAITKPIKRFEVDIDIKDGIYTTNVFVVSHSGMSYEVLVGRELLKDLDIRIIKGRVEIRRPDERSSEVISKESIKSDNYSHVGD